MNTAQITFRNGDYRLEQDEYVNGAPKYTLWAATMGSEKVLFHISDDTAVELYNALGKMLWPSLPPEHASTPRRDDLKAASAARPRDYEYSDSERDHDYLMAVDRNYRYEWYLEHGATAEELRDLFWGDDDE